MRILSYVMQLDVVQEGNATWFIDISVHLQDVDDREQKSATKNGKQRQTPLINNVYIADALNETISTGESGNYDMNELSYRLVLQRYLTLRYQNPKQVFPSSKPIFLSAGNAPYLMRPGGPHRNVAVLPSLSGRKK
jgi:hypothetical protein